MFKINKFQQLCPITAIFQQICPYGIRCQGTEPLFYNAVIGQNGQGIRFYLLVQFMLAAGNGKNHLCVPLNRIIKGQVRSGIAGMQRNDHIYRKRGAKAADIPGFEL